MISWDNYYMGICHAVSVRSKDKSTQLGSVIVDADGLLSTGYNSFPRGINDNLAERQERPEKYKWFVHAEANAIYNAARTGIRLAGAWIYCQWLPCPTCAMAIIQSGIIEVVVSSFNVPERWQGDIEISKTMLMEASILFRSISN
jgi:dCMP deaminase